MEHILFIIFYFTFTDNLVRVKHHLLFEQHVMWLNKEQIPLPIEVKSGAYTLDYFLYCLITLSNVALNFKPFILLLL